MPGESEGQTDITAPEGQAAISPDSGQAGGTPFHTYEDMTFATPDDVNKYLKESTLRQDDYTRKTQSLADMRRQFENERMEFNRGRSDYEKNIEKYKQLDDIMKSNPEAAREMVRLVSGTPQGDDLKEVVKAYLEESGIAQRLNEVEKERKREQADRERDEWFEKLEQQYDDFDRKSVQETYDRLFDENSSMGDFMELLYYANKGKGINPEEIKSDLLSKLQSNRRASVPDNKGASATKDGKSTGDLDIDELREMHKAKLGGA